MDNIVRRQIIIDDLEEKMESKLENLKALGELILEKYGSPSLIDRLLPDLILVFVFSMMFLLMSLPFIIAG